MPQKLIDMTGQKIGLLTVISRCSDSTQGKARWLCQCECGNKCAVNGLRLRRQLTKSCGCLRSRPPSHGLSGSRTYSSWAAMIARCKPDGDALYGRRGIVVCDRWRQFENFLSDMGERPAGTSIDRIDCTGNYEPHNCRWADATTQARNTRSAIRLTINGETKALATWADEVGIKSSVIKSRLKHGWPVYRAVFEKPRKRMEIL